MQGGHLKPLAILVSFAAVLFLVACQGQSAGTSTQGATSPSPTLATPTLTAPQPQEVTFSTKDEVKLAGTFYKGSSTTVVFSHMSDGSRAEWHDVPGLLAARGYSVLAFDFRGRGESEGSFEPSSAAEDLLAAVAYVEAAGAERWVLVGASMGAMASAKVAAVKPADAVVLVAGTTSWRGLTVTDDELAAIKSPMLVITSEGDRYLDGTLHLHDVAGGPKQKHIYDGGAHGTDLLEVFADDFRNRIINFITSNSPLS